MFSDAQSAIGALVAARLFYVRSHLLIFPCWLLFEAWRQFGGDPSTTTYAQLWVRTEPVFLALLVGSAAEAYLRIAWRYERARRFALIAGGLIALFSTVAAVLSCFPAQVAVKWENIPARNWMMAHQLTYWAVTLFLGSAAVVFRIWPASWIARSSIAHVRLLAALASTQAVISLLSNMRVIGAAAPNIEFLSAIALLLCWLPLREWQSLPVCTLDVSDQLPDL